MTIQQFIEKAIEGGLDWQELFYMPKDMQWEDLSKERREEFSRAFLPRIVLNPLAWQAVGKVQKKAELKVLDPEIVEKRIKIGALNRMHNMIDSLADGKTITQYLETL